jgi:sugar lactone lactonase YvrE
MAQAGDLSISRYASNPQTARGWRLERVMGPSPLYGANGMRLGPDGLLYVAECFGNEMSAVDPATGACKTISSNGGPLCSPDDLAFDSRGVMFVTEFLHARVSARTPEGKTEVFAANLPGANGVTIYQDRIFVDECRPEARVMELFRDGHPPRIIAQGFDMANALSVGPDEMLYFPELNGGTVWRVALDGSRLERFVDGLGVPDAVKFDNHGALLVTQALTGEVSRIDLQSRQISRVAMLAPGLDNLVVAPDDRLYVSSFMDGTIDEILPNGQRRNLVGYGMNGPWGVACADDGTVYAADGMAILKPSGAGRWERVGWSFEGDFPGFVRGICGGPGGRLYATTFVGNISAYDPRTNTSEVLASGLEGLFDVACGPGGVAVAVEYEAGRVVQTAPGGAAKVVARGLDHPIGVAVAADGTCFVAETGKRRVAKIEGGAAVPFVEGLERPEGMAVAGGELIVLDAGSKKLISVSLKDGKSQTIASGLPVGCPPGVVPQALVGIPGFMPGPILQFAGVATGGDGTIYVSGNGEGSVLAIRRA